MPLLPQDRDSWRLSWLDSITEISALEWQRRNWSNPANPHYGLTECLEGYFTDLLGGKGYEPLVTNGTMTFDEAFAVAELHLKLEAFAAQLNGGRTGVDSAWLEIADAARRARQRLLKMISATTEREILLHAEPRDA